MQPICQRHKAVGQNCFKCGEYMTYESSCNSYWNCYPVTICSCESGCCTGCCTRECEFCTKELHHLDDSHICLGLVLDQKYELEVLIEKQKDRIDDLEETLEDYKTKMKRMQDVVDQLERMFDGSKF